MCTCACAYTYVPLCVPVVARNIGSPEPRIPGTCKGPYVGSRNQIQVVRSMLKNPPRSQPFFFNFSYLFFIEHILVSLIYVIVI